MFSGLKWQRAAARRGIDLAELPGLAAVDTDDDSDAGDKLSVRAARMTLQLEPVLQDGGFDLVVCDVITVAGGWAAQRCSLPWIELSPHPLYLPSVGLPPIGSGLAAGTGWRGRARDAAMRAATSMSVRQGEQQRSRARASIGMSAAGEPDARFVATLPGLEVYRPDWPAGAHLVGPLLWEPTDEIFDRPTGSEPLVVIAPSTAVTGAADMVATALRALRADELGQQVRVVISSLTPPDDAEVAAFGGPIAAGLGRQDELLTHADLAICGAGHGMLAKTLLAGVPVLAVPGGGDQWELANRLERTGAGRLIRPVTVAGLRDGVRAVLADPGYAAAARRVGATGTQVVDPVEVSHRVVGQ